MIKTVVRNLLSNAVKFTHNNGQIFVKVIENNNIGLVDARPAAFFVGDKKKKQALRAGRIKNSFNLEQQTLVNEDGTFKSVEEIKILISQAGLNGKDGYISYCNTGHWASIGWFALSEIAKEPNVKNYDGSMVDWTFDPDREVIKG